MLSLLFDLVTWLGGVASSFTDDSSAALSDEDHAVSAISLAGAAEETDFFFLCSHLPRVRERQAMKSSLGYLRSLIELKSTENLDSFGDFFESCLES